MDISFCHTKPSPMPLQLYFTIHLPRTKSKFLRSWGTGDHLSTVRNIRGNNHQLMMIESYSPKIAWATSLLPWGCQATWFICVASSRRDNFRRLASTHIFFVVCFDQIKKETETLRVFQQKPFAKNSTCSPTEKHLWVQFIHTWPTKRLSTVHRSMRQLYT